MVIRLQNDFNLQIIVLNRLLLKKKLISHEVQSLNNKLCTMPTVQ